MAFTFVKRAAEIFRDYVVDAIPASGAWNPVKADIRALLLKIEDYLLGTTTIYADDYGVVVDGVTVNTTNYQTALDAAEGKHLVFRPGTSKICLVGRAGFVHSNSKISSVGGVVITAASGIVSANTNAPVPFTPYGTAPMLLTNYNWSAGTPNTNIRIHDIGFDFASAVLTGGHSVHFANASDIRVYDINTNAGDDGISGRGCSRVFVKGNKVIDFTNGGVDFWDGSGRMVFADNIVHASVSASSGYGILVTGVNSDNTAVSESFSVNITGNQVEDCFTLGIWAQGNVANGVTPGIVSKIAIAANIVKNTRGFHSIRASNANIIAITGNTCDGAQYNCINTQGETAGGGPTYLTCTGNVLRNSNLVNSGQVAVTIGAGTVGILSGNDISGGTHLYSYAVQVLTGAVGFVIGPNRMETGATGRVLDGGTGTSLIDTNGVTHQIGAGTASVLSLLGTTPATNPTTGSMINPGGLGNAGAIYAGNEILSTGPTQGVGYGTGAGGAVTQGTSRTTGVTLNKVTGAITLFSAAGSATPASFTLTNSTIEATDVVKVAQKSGTDLYEIFVTNIAAGSCKITFFTTGGTTTEQPVFNFVVIKGKAS